MRKNNKLLEVPCVVLEEVPSKLMAPSTTWEYLKAATTVLRAGRERQLETFEMLQTRYLALQVTYEKHQADYRNARDYSFNYLNGKYEGIGDETENKELHMRAQRVLKNIGRLRIEVEEALNILNGYKKLIGMY